MHCERLFLGWDGPFLQKAVKHLVSVHPPSAGRLDLSAAVIVFPGRRAERRFIELLVLWAEKNNVVFIPPQCCTVGALPELLYQPQRPLAGPLQVHWTWKETLTAADAALVETVFGRRLEDGSSSLCLSWAEKLNELHAELAASCLTFSDAAQKAEGFSHSGEGRWRAAASLYSQYLQRLARLGFGDRHQERLLAVGERRCSLTKPLYLAAASDLPPVLSRMLEQLDQPVIALIHAPEQAAAGFDDTGCLIPGYWQEAEIAIPDEMIRFAADNETQAGIAVALAAQHSTALALDEVTIGACNPDNVPSIVQQFETHGVSIRSAAGRPLPLTEPYLLLKALREYMKSGLFASFAALVRHPDMEAWLCHGEEDALRVYLSILDRYNSEKLPCSMAEPPQPLPEVVLRIKEKIEALTHALKQTRLLCEWPEALFELLGTIYSDSFTSRPAQIRRSVFEACRALTGVAEQLALVKEERELPLGLDSALDLLLHSVARAAIPLPAEAQAVEILGWLELQLDDSPFLIIAGFNEEFVPESVNSDSFLPDGLRRTLGLLDNCRRYCRDAYVTTALLHSRPNVFFLAPQRSSSADALMPSRLLLACEKKTERLLKFYQTAGAVPELRHVESSSERIKAGPPVPFPLAEPVRWMAVTSFADYLACPYRFYLRHVLKLRGVESDQPEMDGRLFGTTAHRILKELGVVLQGGERNEQRLREQADRLIAEESRSVFGKRPAAVVSLQLEQLRLRLHAFLAWQLNDWAEQGWQIAHLELPFRENTAWLPLPEGRMGLRGTIDRIDFNARTGAWAIFDYKVGDTDKAPDKEHLKRGSWVNLQLPLYRELFRLIEPDAQPELAFLVLGRDGVKANFARWTEDALRQARETAIEVARDVAAHCFWPPNIDGCSKDEFADICGTKVLAPLDADEVE